MIIKGDCLIKLKDLDSNSVDTIITDPPYGLSFMGKKWDYDVPSIEIWKECLRVLKPGGTALIFAGSRTQHRMAVNVEDAGFILKDTIMWLYGSGFPKATDISKQLDKSKGLKRKGIIKTNGSGSGEIRTTSDRDRQLETTYETGNPLSTEAKLWNGWKSHGLKPAYEPILVCMKPNDGTYASNALKWGVSGLNIDGGRIGNNGGSITDNKANFKNNVFGNGLGGCKTLSTNIGRFPANIILDEEAGAMLDEQSGELSQGHWAKTKVTGFGKFGNGHSEYLGVGKKDKSKHGASRFFKNIKNEKVYKKCSICYITLQEDSNEEKWKNTNVNNAEKNLMNTQATKENTAQKNVMEIPRKKLDQIVKYVGNLCQKCATDFVQELVVISEHQKGVQSLEASQAIQDFIIDYKKCTLLQNLVDYVEKWDNIDTTQITQNLLKLFGFVQVVIKNYIQKIEKSEPKRFLYQAKASKSERNAGCEALETKTATQITGRKEGSKGLSGSKEYGNSTNPYANGGSVKPRSNHHPTVKPLKLMEYLCTITKTPTGGIVLDPFAGSGTTGVACINTGRKYILIEREEEYIEIIKARLLYTEEVKKYDE